MELAAADIQVQLERILASQKFESSPQLANFLRYVVEETLAGNGDRFLSHPGYGAPFT